MKFLKKIFAILLFIGMANYAEAKKILVVYFSHTGNTKLIAERIAEEFSEDDVDVRRIETEETYPRYSDELLARVKKESKDNNFKPKLKNLDVKVRKYDLILVGSPVWWYKALPAVKAFLEKQDFSGKEVRFFITHGGGPGTCISDMEEVCKGAKFGTNIDVYCASPGNGKVDYSKIGPWVKKLKAEGEQPEKVN